jgi:hypothetical protein
VKLPTNYTPIAPITLPQSLDYNASAVKMNNAASSLVRFENKNIFFYLEKTL